MTEAYRLVHLANGATSVHDILSEETFHPVVGPAAEAKTLYVEQLRLRERIAVHSGEFTLWDIGLGAAANALTALHATSDLACPVRVESFDRTTAALAFALEHRGAMGYFGGYEVPVRTLINDLGCAFNDGSRPVNWRVHLGEIPELLSRSTKVGRVTPCEPPSSQPSVGKGVPALPAPDAILFDPCSMIRNPEMWTASLFRDLYCHLDAGRPCSLATYSRSTMIRVTLLLAGFHVGAGRGVGEKEETTVAANTVKLIEQPLDARWLERAFKSGAAQPMREAVYRQASLNEETRERLRSHPQFN